MASTAAVLNIMVKANAAQAQATLGKTQGALVATDKTAGRTADKLKKGMKIAGVGMAAGIGIGVVAIKKFATAAAESEASNARMRAQLKASGISFGKHKDQIEKVIAAQSKLSALDDEDLQDSFTNIVRVTGDVNKALKLNALAADFARAKNIDVAKAGELVAKVAGGNTSALSRYGIKIKEGATATEALGVLQKKFAGQAKAYGETSAGAADRFKVAVGNLQEALGARLLPILSKVMNFGANFVNSLLTGSGAAGGFGKIVGDVFTKIKAVVGTVVGFLSGQFDKHRDDLANVGGAARNVGKAISFVWQQVVWPVIKRVLPAIVTIIKGAFNIIGGLVKALSSLLKGDFRGAWDAVKQIFRGALQVVGGIIRAATAPFREAAARVGGAISGAFSNAWDRVKTAFRDAKQWIGDRFSDLKGMASSFAGGMKDRIVGAFKGAVNVVIGFVNNILSVVDRIPGVNVGRIKKFAEGGQFQAFAHGGAFQRTRGKVNKPITLMGEEAPRFPEYVIPTNPAYRRRAQGLLAQAAGAVGFASGGINDGSGNKFAAKPGLDKGGFSVPSVSSLLSALPGAKSLGWLSGLGSFVLGKVGAWIKDRVKNLLGTGITAWSFIDKLARQHGLGITSTFRNQPGSFHGQMGPGGRARATDYSNSTAPTAQMMSFAQDMRAKVGKNLAELFYSPMRGSIKNGQWVPGMIIGGGLGTPGNHYNHVHVAFGEGGEYGQANGNGGITIIHNGPMNLTNPFERKKLAADLAWRIQTS